MFMTRKVFFIIIASLMTLSSFICFADLNNHVFITGIDAYQRRDKIGEADVSKYVNMHFVNKSSARINSVILGYEYQASNMPYFYFRFMGGKGFVDVNSLVDTRFMNAIPIHTSALVVSCDAVMRAGWNFVIGDHKRTSITPFIGVNYFTIWGEGQAELTHYTADVTMKFRSLKPLIGFYLERKLTSWLDLGLILQFNYLIYDKDHIVAKKITLLGDQPWYNNNKKDIQFTFEVPLTFCISKRWEVQFIAYDPDIFADDGKAWRARIEIRRHF